MRKLGRRSLLIGAAVALACGVAAFTGAKDDVGTAPPDGAKAVVDVDTSGARARIVYPPSAAQASEMARDWQKLVDAALPSAKQQLSAAHGFHPYAVGLTADGRIVNVGPSAGDDHSSNEELRVQLTQALRAQVAEGTLTATAIVSTGRMQTPDESAKRDAILIRVEHRGGEANIVSFPYSFGTAGGVVLGEASLVPALNDVFPDP